ncbi:neutral zinc metallopeptidase [Pelagivirga sediminicola]|uniref:Neutral zinc metallopeptidase n=1 Tax=Pelagivirga sediminicola TaxID=2170575 RepID=A0A2T7GAE9_9RHOB|nr:metallopeptidase family protein [Pelagivirga sediminicola]PVA11383.1 neutral zinc metallopeptidase [Pelagivirga sediminicola]
MSQHIPTLDEMEQIARDTVDALPAPFADAAAQVALRVLDMPDAALLADLDMDDPMQLTGLYEGVPMTHKSVAYPSPWPDTVWLFRRPILAELATRPGVTLEQLVAHVTVHEFAHHFGWSDDDIATIDRWWE